MNQDDIRQAATAIIGALGAVLVPMLIAAMRTTPRLINWLTAATTRELLTVLAHATELAGAEAARIIRLRLDAAAKSDSPGGATVTADERRQALEAGVVAALDVLTHSGLLDKVLQLLAPNPGVAMAILRQRIMEGATAQLGEAPLPPPAPLNRKLRAVKAATLLLLLLAGSTARAEATALRDQTFIASTTPRALGGTGCGVLVHADPAAVAWVGGPGTVAGQGVQLCRSDAGCTPWVFIPAAPANVWAVSPAGAVLRFTVLAACARGP